MGFVFQAYNLLDALTAYDNVALPARLAGEHVDRQAVLGALRAGRSRRTRRGAARPSCPAASSSASRSPGRCTPARRCCSPTSPPAPSTAARAAQVLELLRRLSDEQGQTVVMVTHDPLAASYAHGVLFLADGQIVGRLQHGDAASIAAAMSELER